MQVLKNPLIIIFFSLCAIIFSLSMYQGTSYQSNPQEIIKQYELKNAALLQEKEVLEFKKQLSAKKIVQEKVIRDDLWHQKPGEVILDLTDFKEEEGKWVAPTTPPVSPLQNWISLFQKN